MRFAGKEAVFCYGTLLLPQYQQRLFGARLPCVHAVLPGWRLRMGFDGYRFIQPSPHKSVHGKLIRLTPQQLKKADEWEDTPYYRREQVVFRNRHQAMTVWVYSRRNGKGRPCPPHLLTTHSNARLVLRRHRHLF
ncbi:gamma-glutamylcyclotransferase family protein [uncultured Alteromonas sp.]|jgi:gamma-glutamylcyclotransferase (GGCT)/AIG2-like uncharacterized protein YtfP|uniref:gamma-glutamylcyclotransferase family protein n=1 Tax=uncultured Alteromonas sp. TaxID=179113 RepID=UPI0025FFA8DD|nr:gamma-glutamylcyclotransferase family protein [uncultured Alteromonas sp.]